MSDSGDGSHNASHEQRSGEHLDRSIGDGGIKLNPLLARGSIETGTGTAARSSLWAALTIVVPSAVSVVLTAATRRVTSVVCPVTTSVGRSVSVPASIGRSRTRTSLISGRRLDVILEASITRIAMEGSRCTPRLLSIWWLCYIGLWCSPRNSTSSQTLNDGRNLIKGHALIGKGFYQENLLLGVCIKSTRSSGRARHAGEGWSLITGVCWRCTLRRGVLCQHLSKRERLRGHI
jgi:hypothetical protein